MVFGSDLGRFYEYTKRLLIIYIVLVLYKNCNDSLYSMYSLCTFYNEYSGNFNFGVIGRGSSMEIGTYISNFVDDELSGI
jgi:hypothetical protein